MRGFTVIMISLEIAVAGFAQNSLEVSTQLTTSLSARVVLDQDAPLAPANDIPFTLHWYSGADPSPVTFDVKFTVDPEQMVVGAPSMTITGDITGTSITVSDDSAGGQAPALPFPVAVIVRTTLPASKTSGPGI
jgi:hypothetical protein